MLGAGGAPPNTALNATIPSNILFMAVIKIIDNSLLLGVALRPGPVKKKFKQEVLDVSRNQIARGMKQDEIALSKTPTGAWYAFRDLDVLYFILINPYFQERFVRVLQSEIKQELAKTPGFSSQPPKTLSRIHKQNIRKLLNKYDQPESWDTLARANVSVEDVTQSVKGSIERVLMNTQNIERLHFTTNEMRNQVYLFEKNSETLQGEMENKNLKIRLVLACITGTLLIMVFMMFFGK